jgi:hypothetical protein
MRYGLLALMLAACTLGGCACEHPTAFWWNTRLVPANDNAPLVSGTGATEYAPVAAVPVHDMH